MKQMPKCRMPKKNESGEYSEDVKNILVEQGHSPSYKIYTTQFDEEIKAEDLAGNADLKRLRDMLDTYLERYQSTISRLANRLQRKLMAQQQRSWKFDLEKARLTAPASPAWSQTHLYRLALCKNKRQTLKIRS